MYEMKFSCSGCIFTEMTPGSGGYWQIGCELDRIENLKANVSIDDGGESGSYAYFNRFCNTYRPSQWLDLIEGSPRSNVMREVSPSVGFFVLFKSDIENPLEELKNTALSIKNQKGDHQARYVVVINDKVEYNEDILNILKGAFDDHQLEGHLPTEYSFVQSLINTESNFDLLDEAFAKAKNGWAYITESTVPVPLDLLDKIHQRINIDMKRLVVVEPKDKNLNGMIFQTAVFKLVSGSRPIVDSESLLLNTKNFIERVKEIETEDPDTIITWEEFNA